MIRLTLFLCCLSFSVNAQIISLQELVNRKQYAEVISRAVKFNKDDSTDFKTMYAVGDAYDGLLKYKDAYRVYNYCMTMDSTNLDLMNAMARTATNLGKISDAKYYFRKVLAMDSCNFYANYQLARLHFQLEEFQNAMNIYSALLDKDMENSSLWRNMGDCYSRMKQMQNAALSYFKAYSLNRENASLASALINTLLHLGGPNATDALAICDTALYYNPGNRLLRQNKGMALYTNKQYAKADSIYTELMAEGDSSYNTVSYAGVSRYNAGLYLTSIEPLELAYKMDTTSAEVCLLLGSALGKTYDRKRAFELLDKAENNMQPSELLVNQLLLFRAETYKKDRKFKESSSLYYEAYLKNPKQLECLFHISEMYAVQNIEDYATDEEKQRGLFIQYLLANEYNNSGQDTKQIRYLKKLLQSFYEDMFFQGVKELPMLAPDGKKSKLAAENLKYLIDKLEQTSQKTNKP